MGTCDIVEPYNIEYRLVRSDGEIRDINSRGAKTANRLGEPNFMHGTAQDITERHQAEQRFRRARPSWQNFSFERTRHGYGLRCLPVFIRG
jgi:hypothetical protein